MRLHLSVLISLLVLCNIACEKQKKVNENRQASPEIRESFKNPSAKTIALEKSALGKVFLMIANSKTTGNQSAWIEHPVKLITFERSGSKVGVFEVGYDQIYDTLDSQKLLQTLEITSESSQTLVLNIESGLIITGEEAKLGIMRVEPTEEALQKHGYEEAVRAKDILVKDAELVGNSLRISQKWRLFGLMLKEEKSRYKQVDQTKQQVYELETSYDTRIEIIPYVESETFVPKEQDSNWSIGSFVTRIRKLNRAESELLALRWDTSVSTPIRYIISGNTPEEAVPYIKEGLEYWNRVAGRTILQVEVSEETDIEPQDRAVIVRWIPWRDAGYAYAGMQFNPLTGQIYRGQIFLTSSWLNSGGLEKKISDASVMEFPQGACQMTQQISKHLQDLESAVQENPLHARMDYFRSVVAHEAGHTLGMRHHFAAASQVKVSFEEILQARKEYSQNPGLKKSYPNFTLSVMDYPRALDSAIVGNSLLERALPYDKDFIDWNYNDAEILTSSPRALCTDDHVRYASEEGITIFGCGTFKPVGDPLLAALEDRENDDLTAVRSDIESLLYSHIDQDGEIKKIEVPRFFFGISRSEMQTRSVVLDNYLFSATDMDNGAEKNVLLSPQSVTSAIVNGYGYAVSTDYSVTESLGKSLELALSNPSLRGYILPVNSAGDLDLNWLENSLNKLNFSRYRKGKTPQGVDYEMTAEQFVQFKEVVHKALRDTFKQKLNLSLRRLLVDQVALINSLVAGSIISEKNVILEPRRWVKDSNLTSLLKTYAGQLLTAVIDEKVIEPSLSKDLLSHTADVYAVELEDFEILKKSLSDSGIYLGISLEPIAQMREQKLLKILEGTRIRLISNSASSELLDKVEQAYEMREIEKELYESVTLEAKLIQSMREAETI